MISVQRDTQQVAEDLERRCRCPIAEKGIAAKAVVRRK